MNAEDKEFWGILENEGMEGILKKYTPIEDIVEILREQIAEKDKQIKILERAFEIYDKERLFTLTEPSSTLIRRAGREIEKDSEEK